MLTSLSVHGLPGMAAGLLLNGTMLAGFTLIWRRLERRPQPNRRNETLRLVPRRHLLHR